jgi:DNA (cytosine-5)-methyltransferase 1
MKNLKKLKFIDLFCGVGGFRYAAKKACDKLSIKSEFVFSCDIDKECQEVYLKNFKDLPTGDISIVDENSIKNHKILLAGFPCQPFSIIGKKRGFSDARGTLFFDIARIIEAKQPSAFVLENVKMLKGHNDGKTLKRIIEVLQNLGYYVDFKILNALDFGLPQKRERIFIVGLKDTSHFSWPTQFKKMKPLINILEKEVDKKHYASQYIVKKRRAFGKPGKEPTIWHENKSGNVSILPYSCALRAGASYNYLLVDGLRRLTPREMFRLQGYPENFKIVCNDSQSRKQAGNSLPIPVASAVIQSVISSINTDHSQKINENEKIPLFQSKESYAVA